MAEGVHVSMSHDYATYDAVTQQALLAEYGETLPIRDLEGPISARGDYLMRLMDNIQSADPSARISRPHNGADYETMQAERRVRIFTTLSNNKLSFIEDVMAGNVEQLEEVS